MGLFSKKRSAESMMFLAQWGGYYTTQAEDGTYRVWRMLDFNRDAVHYTMFDTKFDHRPSFDEAVNAHVFALHIPQSTGFLLNQKDLALLGWKPLTMQDLNGLRTYLEMNGAPQDKLDEFLEKLISFSTEHPAFVKITAGPDDQSLNAESPTEKEIRQAALEWQKRGTPIEL